ncbi:MAG: RagB/SusD family nutrient uptake outer membrane protein [Dysgonamonadaceae bacterium]|jgi:hypothetical protein|nr:RagB/SusD family nutrient uptake outer membrane protein [Dysgonamonadaceae bacterium]
MKRYYYILLVGLLPFVSACEDWIVAPTPGLTTIDDFFQSSPGNASIQVINGCYTPIKWEYYTTYISDWFIGDIMSDDALKGGQSVSDISDIDNMENFKIDPNNTFLLEHYKAPWIGIARCNIALKYIPSLRNDSVLTPELKSRMIGEAKFLRALYYFRLVRVYGDVPYIDFPLEKQSDWKQPYLPKEEIYEHIIADLEDANKSLWPKSKYPAQEMGRATKGAAQAFLLKVNLYKADLFTKDYTAAKAWGDSVIASNEYRLVDDYADNFSLDGENGPESVFEIQYMFDGNSDYDDGKGAHGFGFQRGTFTVVLTRPRTSQFGGWGFNKPTQNLYDEYETNDPRRDITIYNPTDAAIETPEQEIYLGCRYMSRKYALLNQDGSMYPLVTPKGEEFPIFHPTRYPINNKVVRYADVLLMYAETCVETGDLQKAKDALEQVRSRARRGDTSILPAFPNYRNYKDTKDDLRLAIRHERRVELAMESHRWYDICRWGIMKEVMTTYMAGETQAVRDHAAPFDISNSSEYFPIPTKELDINPKTVLDD